MKNLFITTILCLSLLLAPFGGAYLEDVYAADSSPRILHNYATSDAFDDGATTIGNPGSLVIVDDPLSDGSHGKVAYLEGSSGQIMDPMSNTNKIRVTFDFLAGTSTTSCKFTIRGVNASGATALSGNFIDLSSGKVNNVAISVNKWYHADVTLDYARGKKTISVVDSLGNAVISPSEANLSLGSIATNKQSHVRFNTTGQFYFDNFVVEEYIILADLDKVTGGSDEVKPMYTNNVLKVTMTQNMGTVKPEHITITRDLDGSDIPISSVSKSGKVLTLTLGKSLQSSSVYTLTVKETAPMSYSSTPVGQDMSVKFTTSARELDITDVTFTSDGSNASCVATVTNAAASDASVVIMMSAFDASGRVTGINYTTVAVNAVDSAASAPLQLPVTSGGYVKVLGIADFTTLAPLNNNIYTFRLE